MKSISRKGYEILSRLLSKKDLHLIRSLSYFKKTYNDKVNRLDYIRLSCLELAGEEIYKKNIPGNAAELGVYRGDFAKDINRIFHNRSLYLFDTFRGFDQRDTVSEKNKGFSDATQDFSDTSVESVLQKMPFRERCVVKQGFFPQSAEGLEDTFCFVSIDTDLYEPVLAGLRYFFPRMSKGGFIFIHDYNNELYKGTREAVEQFCEEVGCTFIPVADIGGSAIIRKT